ncbi:hypothetical protein CGGC5_v005841 [Colletotrichum fructicola Nara gc5]|uniref:Uncharacterized protein n=1 Tax=Colletotrichum fructicola (strain Nara gc5) TaxID=1213859 RepID=A0A7J6J801_COLFN|nr:hypothetical protein CGGC5_v005841 [Colletotrichum fructicola Nara gc5]
MIEAALSVLSKYRRILPSHVSGDPTAPLRKLLTTRSGEAYLAKPITPFTLVLSEARSIAKIINYASSSIHLKHFNEAFKIQHTAWHLSGIC